VELFGISGILGGGSIEPPRAPLVTGLTLLVEKDPLILSFGNRLLGKHGSNENQIRNYISQKMSKLGHLLEASKIVNSNKKKLQDIMEPVQWGNLISAVQKVAGYNESMREFDTPSIALKVGNKLLLLVEDVVKLHTNSSGPNKQY